MGINTIERAKIKAFITGFLSDPAHDNQSSRSMTAEVFRIALASLEAKPIGAFHIADQQVGGTTDYIKDGEWPIDDGVIEVYAAPPVPVVPEEMPKGLAGQIVSLLAHNIGDEFLAQKIWNACCAAMLQGADGNSPVNQDGWVACSERMPKFGDYLVTDGQDFDVQMFNGEQFIPGFVWEDNITHWMPLPAAPQKGA